MAVDQMIRKVQDALKLGKVKSKLPQRIINNGRAGHHA